jgi:erythromycin esterase-like protein
MPAVTEGSLVHIVAEGAQPLTGDHTDFDAVVSLATNARVVLIGEASHGTHEFYRIRAEITKRLIRELGFNGVAAEADWPDAHRINRYLHARGSDADATDALRDFVARLRALSAVDVAQCRRSRFCRLVAGAQR